MLGSASILLAAMLQMAGGQGDGMATSEPLPRMPASPFAASEAYEGALGELEVYPHRVEAADIRIDGRLTDQAWLSAPILTGFTQYDPVEGIPASQRTEIRVLVSGDAIYFGVRAHDDQPEEVRATLAKRDGFGGSDDYVRIILDTFNDQRRGFVFQVNPLGIQADGLWAEGQGGRGDPIDWNPDLYWESAGRLDPDGYSVELKIPLKSLRFPEKPVQDWGLQVVRQIRRSGFSESWAPLSGESANKLSQAGKLRGLAGLKPGRFLEVNPVLTATRQGVWDSGSESLSRGPASGDLGVNVAYGITSNLTLDATYNPDFSQVEADAGQIAVNERFALYFPEKRPFFLEGTGVFSMPRRLVYTRSIASPLGAAKLSGKVGSFNLAYIGALDQAQGGARNPAVNLLRVKRDVGTGSSLGMVYTDRTSSAREFNRVFGADGRFVLGQRYTLEFLAASSADKTPGSGTEYGSLILAEFRRSSRGFTMSGSFEDASSGFRARSGFLRRVGTTQIDARAAYSFRGEAGDFVERWGPSLSVESIWNRDRFWSGGGPQEFQVQASLSVSLRGNMGGNLSYSRDSYGYTSQDYDGYFFMDPSASGVTPFAPPSAVFGGLDRVSVRGWISRWEQVRVSLGGSWGETPIFASGAPVDIATEWSGNLEFTLQPSNSLSMELSARHSSLFRKRDGSRYSSALIPRFQARYQLSRALFVRTVGEYSSQVRGALLDPILGAPVLSCDDTCEAREGVDAFDLRMEGLFGYEPSPGTVVYVGYSRNLRDTEAFGFRGLTTQADGVFVKVSYLLRM